MEQTKDIIKYKDQSSALLEIIDKLSSNTNVDADKFKQIVEVFEHIGDKNAEQAFNADMVQAQAEMPIVPKDALNRQTNSMYSKYETVLKYTKPIYTKYGFSLLFYEGDTPKENNIRVVVDVMHKDGHTKTRFVDVPVDDKGIKGNPNKTQTHAKGSSLSYGKGYLVKMVFNIPTGDDDDGNGAGSQPITEEQKANINTLQQDKKITNANMKVKLKKHFGTESIDDLNFEQANKCISMMNLVEND